MFKRGLHEHALTNARAIGCGIKPTADALTKPNRYFAACRGFPPARLTDISTIGLRIKIGQLLHFPKIPKSPTIETAASRYD
jgi:hypothetical protein